MDYLPKQLLFVASCHNRCPWVINRVQPDSSHHLPPSQMLQTARQQLLAIFVRNFQNASQSRDSAATTRFFKMFPAIGWENEGLEVYSRFIVELIKVRVSTSTNGMSPVSHRYLLFL